MTEELNTAISEEYIEIPDAPTEGNAEAENESEAELKALLEDDIKLLSESFPELRGISDISELENPIRYGALRDLGLSAEEAYKATSSFKPAKSTDTRAHLRSSAPRRASSPVSAMSYREMETARALFSDMSDAEIQRLYRKVTR